MTEGARYTTSEERDRHFPQARFIGNGSKSISVDAMVDLLFTEFIYWALDELAAAHG